MNHISIMASRLTEIKLKNPSYSMRAFAKSLGLSPATLSQVLSGKRNLSWASGLKVIERLQLNEQERQVFIASLRPDPLSTELAERTEKMTMIELSRFHMISDWYHYALLSLFPITPAPHKLDIFAERLGLPIAKVSRAIDVLLELGIISKVESGCYVQIQKHLFATSTDPWGSPAIRRHHRQMIEKSLDALHEMPPSDRDFGSLTIAFDRRRMAELQSRLRDMRQAIACEFDLEGCSEDAEVGQLNMQFFPLTT